MCCIRFSIRGESLCLPPEARSVAGAEGIDDGLGKEWGFAFQQGGRYLLKLENLGAFVVESGYRQVVGFPDEGVPPSRLQEMFFHRVAPWLLQRQEWDTLHGSAVLTNGGVLAFSGPQRRGKSTLARAWSERGGVAYADDAVPFLVRDGAVLAAQLPQRLKLREPSASRFEPYPVAETAVDGREVVHDLESTLRPLRAVYWLEAMAGDARNPVSRLQRVPPAEAFPLLLSEVHYFSLRDPDCNRKMVRNYLTLAQTVPVFRLSFAPDLDLLPAVLDQLAGHQRDLP